MIRLMIRATLTILGFCCICHSADAAYTVIPMDDDGTSVVAIGGVADPAILALLAGFSGAGASYPAQWEGVIAETSGNSRMMSPQEARDFLRLATEQKALNAVGSLSSQNSSKSLVVQFSASDPAGALSWLRSLPNDERNNVTFVDLISVSLGGSESGSDALHKALEIALALVGNGVGIIEGDRYRSERLGRGGNQDNDRETAAQDWIDSGVANYREGTSGYDFVNLQAIPEPSVSLLGALAGLGLLRRRR